MKSKFSTLLAIAMAGFFTMARAADDGPQVHTQGSIAYITSGGGRANTAALELVAEDYPLELEFLMKAKPRDEYLFPIKVQIVDMQERTVLDVTCNGPFLLARLPAGRYVVKAKYSSEMKNRQVQILPQERRRIVFEWRP